MLTSIHNWENEDHDIGFSDTAYKFTSSTHEGSAVLKININN